MRTLVLTDDDAVIGGVMYDDVISVSPETEEEDVVADIFKYDIPAMPVVDEAGKLLGIVTTEDAWDAIEDDITQDKKHPRSLVVFVAVVCAIIVLAVYTFVLIEIMRASGMLA